MKSSSLLAICLLNLACQPMDPAMLPLASGGSSSTLLTSGGMSPMSTAMGGAQNSSLGGSSANSEGGTATGGSTSNYSAGGASSGGSIASGGATGGAMSTGGRTTGGSANGGATIGGVATGGSATGGKATGGGSSIGGSATGGKATGGGSSIGGSATGGSMTGGSMTGGSMTGGSMTGGTTSVGQGIRLEAEDYVAAYDTTSGNSGNCFRTGDVDVESCAEGGFDVAWVENGEWLEYDFDVTAADRFNLVTRTATPFGNATGLQLMIDGVAVSSFIAVPMTRAWQEWTDVTVSNVALAAGRHRLRANLGGNFNIDYFYVVSATNPPSVPPKPGPGTPPTAPSGYVSPVSRHGQLRVVGTSLRNAQNQPVQLRGLSTHGLQWFPPVKNHTIPRLAYDWGISWIRPAMYVEDIKNGGYWGGYLAQPAYMKEKVIECVEDALAVGIYVVIDWHIHNNPENFTDAAIAYFKDMATRYGSRPNIIYEICNEPEYVDWSVVKSYANKVIPEIRKIDPDNLIIVGTPNWSQWVDVAAADRLPNDANVMYALHFYAGAHKAENRQRAQTALDLGLPIIASEWGTSDYTGGTNNITDLAESQIWLDWLNARGISWTNWNFSNKGETSAVLQPGVGLAGPWADAELTASGRYIKQALASP